MASFQINFGSWGFWRLGLHLTSCMETFYVCFKWKIKVPVYFSCLGECYKAVVLWSSRNGLWTTKHHLNSYFFIFVWTVPLNMPAWSTWLFHPLSGRVRTTKRSKTAWKSWVNVTNRVHHPENQRVTNSTGDINALKRLKTTCTLHFRWSSNSTRRIFF